MSEESTTRTWLAHFNGRAEMVAISMRDISTDDLGKLQNRVARRFGGGDRDYAQLVDITRIEQACGVPYEWGLAGANGACFELFQLPGVTSDQVQLAKNELRRTRDVVHIMVTKLTSVETGEGLRAMTTAEGGAS